MASRKKIVFAALAIAAIMTIASVFAFLTSTKTIPSSGTISSYRVGVYTNESCTTQVPSITFNQINPGGTDAQTVWIRNDAASSKMTLSMTTSDWSSTNATYDVVTLTFNQTGTVLNPGAKVPANLTLTADDDAETRDGLSFTMKINIIGTETP
jgi:hypothetical protein